MCVRVRSVCGKGGGIGRKRDERVRETQCRRLASELVQRRRARQSGSVHIPLGSTCTYEAVERCAIDAAFFAPSTSPPLFANSTRECQTRRRRRRREFDLEKLLREINRAPLLFRWRLRRVSRARLNFYCPQKITQDFLRYSM